MQSVFFSECVNCVAHLINCVYTVHCAITSQLLKKLLNQQIATTSKCINDISISRTQTLSLSFVIVFSRYFILKVYSIFGEGSHFLYHVTALLEFNH